MEDRIKIIEKICMESLRPWEWHYGRIRRYGAWFTGEIIRMKDTGRKFVFPYPVSNREGTERKWIIHLKTIDMFSDVEFEQSLKEFKEFIMEKRKTNVKIRKNW